MCVSMCVVCVRTRGGKEEKGGREAVEGEAGGRGDLFAHISW